VPAAPSEMQAKLHGWAAADPGRRFEDDSRAVATAATSALGAQAPPAPTRQSEPGALNGDGPVRNRRSVPAEYRPLVPLTGGFVRGVQWSGRVPRVRSVVGRRRFADAAAQPVIALSTQAHLPCVRRASAVDG
jgi:hypothetical protein